MKLRTAIYFVGAFVFMSITITFITLKAQSIQKKIEPKVVLNQMDIENGAIPVEIQRPQVDFKEQRNKIGSFSFVVHNNTYKNIIAFCLAYTVKTERNGVQSRDVAFQTVATSVVKDFHEASEPVSWMGPGSEIPVSDNGETLYDEDVNVTGVEAILDYVEFEDGSILGKNTKGGSLIGKMRQGSLKYKDWLFQQYLTNGRSIEAIGTILEAKDLSNDLELGSPEEISGAKNYRSQALKFYNLDGPRKLEKIINKTKTTIK